MSQELSISEYNVNEVYDFDINLIETDFDLVDSSFDPVAIDSAKNCIVNNSDLIKPVILIHTDTDQFYLAIGELVLKAYFDLNYETIPARIVDGDLDDIKLLQIIFYDNTCPLHRSLAMQMYLDKYQLSRKNLSKILDLKCNSISEILSLNKLPQYIKNVVFNDKRYSLHTLREIARIKDPEEQREKFNLVRNKIENRSNEASSLEAEKTKESVKAQNIKNVHGNVKEEAIDFDDEEFEDDDEEEYEEVEEKVVVKKETQSRVLKSKVTQEKPKTQENKVKQSKTKEVAKAKEAKPVQEAKQAKDVKNVQAAKQAKAVTTVKSVKQAQEIKPVKEDKPHKEVKQKEVKSVKEVKQAKDVKPVREVKHAKEEKQVKKEEKQAKEVKTSAHQKQQEVSPKSTTPKVEQKQQTSAKAKSNVNPIFNFETVKAYLIKITNELKKIRISYQKRDLKQLKYEINELNEELKALRYKITDDIYIDD